MNSKANGISQMVNIAAWSGSKFFQFTVDLSLLKMGFTLKGKKLLPFRANSFLLE